MPEDPVPHDDPRWIALGTDIVEGREVDWDQVDREAADDQRRALVENLRCVAQLVKAQHGMAGQTADEPLEPTGHWRHLVLLEQVGAGAFGTVYRAWDTRLDREVAVKFLTPRQTGDSPLAAARHLARIRHPNVVTVFGAELDGDTVAIWMEFVQGETLAEMVRRGGPLSLREAAGIGLDLCGALSALHATSLLHGDINAHNVMREVGGRIVLMDVSGVRPAMQEEVSLRLSGTPLYMAPELFAGRSPSVASDIYGLGVLLFHLLSGRYPVEGPTRDAVAKAHTVGTPNRLRDLRPDLPDTIIQIVERALAVDPKQRYQTAGAFERALSFGSAARPQFDAPAEPVAAARFVPRWLQAAGAVTVLAAAAAAGFMWSDRTGDSDPLMVRLTIGPPYNTVSWPRISPDGRFVIYGTIVENAASGRIVGEELLFIRPLDSLSGRPLVGKTIRESGFWSADARHVLFFDDGMLRRIEVATGTVQTLASAQHPMGGSANRDGTVIFAAGGVIQRVESNGSGLRPVTALDTAGGEEHHGWPEFLPDGRRFLYIVRNTDPDKSALYLGSLDSTGRQRLMPAFSRAVYAPTGHLLFVREGVLLAQPFDPARAALSGEPRELAAPVKAHAGSDAAFDVSGNGVLIYRQAESAVMTRVQIFDRRGRALDILTPRGIYRHPRISPDGQRVAVERTEEGSSSPDIWLLDMVRLTASRFTNNLAPDIRPTWSPDGRRIAFSSRRDGKFDLYVKPVSGTEPERLLDSSPGNKHVESWSHDGRLLTVAIPRSGLWLFSLDGAVTRTLLRASDTAEAWQSQFSPDGRWLAYVSEESGIPEVYVEPVPATGDRWQLSTYGGTEPHWREDGREVLYLGPDGSIVSVDVGAGRRWEAGNPEPLFQVAIPDAFGGSDISLSADGEHLVVNQLVGEGAIPPINVVVNWSGLLRQ